jgi:hypothetical protein
LAIGAEPEPAGEPIRVIKPVLLGTDALPAERIAIGEPDDYKPCLARLNSGELAIVAFHQHPWEGGKIREDMLRFRSTDGGRKWSRAERLDLLGREPYFSMTRGGTLFITTHLLEQDVRNQSGYVHSYLHRSTDGGATWQTLQIGAQDVPGAPADAWVLTSRNVLELADGTLVLGVSAPRGIDYLWKSADGGRSWDKAACRFDGVPKEELWWPFMAETFFWQAPGGDLLGIWRVDHKVFHLPGTAPPEERSDQYERMIVFRSRDAGQSWRPEKDLGTYGEMYPALLRLGGGRLLLTFTVRAVHPPLGVHALLGKEQAGGFVFDFGHDRLVLDAKTPLDKPSGGGFGPTVELGNGTLVTAYSYRGADDKTRLEVVRWRLPERR